MEQYPNPAAVNPSINPSAKSSGRKFTIIITAVLISLTILSSVYYIYTRYVLPAALKSKPQVIKISQKQPKLIFASRLQPPQDPKLADIIFNCPVKIELCESSQSYKNGILETKLNPDAPIYAAFDGTVSVLPAVHPESSGKNEEYLLILLTSQKRGLQAMYYLKGKANQQQNNQPVKAGDLIGNSNGKPINFLNNQSLWFQVLKMTKDKGENMALSPSNFKNQ